MEEALDSTGSGKENTEQMKEMIGEFFEQGTEVYKGEGNSECNGITVTLTVSWSGYVDDPRNTDNAWMETVAFHFHDDTGELACLE